MNNKQESLFAKFLKPEQIDALKEEIVNGIRRANSAIESDQQLKLRKESLKKIMIKINEAMDSDATPLFIKILYKTVKIQVIESVEKIFSDRIKESKKEDTPQLLENDDA